METLSPAEADLIARLQTYADVCNRYDIAAALALFTPDGALEYRGEVYQGAALRAAHEYDQGARNQITLRDCTVEGNVVRCTFVATDELCRILGREGPSCPAVFTFEDGRIARFVCGAPDAEVLAQHREAGRPFFAWVREYHPDLLGQPWTFDFAGGDELRRMAEAWRDRPADAPNGRESPDR